MRRERNYNNIFYLGIPITAESFKAWKAKFDAEVKETKKSGVDLEKLKKPTGRQLFEIGIFFYLFIYILIYFIILIIITIYWYLYYIILWIYFDHRKMFHLFCLIQILLMMVSQSMHLLWLRKMLWLIGNCLMVSFQFNNFILFLFIYSFWL